MKIYCLINTLLFMSSSLVYCHRHFHRETKESETFTHTGPSLEDKEVLKEALHLLNIGKKTLGLSTENPDALIQLIENSSEKADQIQHILKEPVKNDTSPKGEQYLVLSGRNGLIRLDNFTNTTEISKELGSLDNNTGIDDLFKMVMEKRYPGKTGKGKVYHKITIIESNQIKPFDRKEFPKHIPAVVKSRLRRHKSRSLKRIFSIPHPRRKRNKDSQEDFENYLNGEINGEGVVNNAEDEFQTSLIPVLGDKILLPYYINRMNYPNLLFRKIVNHKIKLPKNKRIQDAEFKEHSTSVDWIALSTTTKSPIFKKNASPASLTEIFAIEKSLVEKLSQLPILNYDKKTNFQLIIEFAVLLSIVFVCVLLTLMIYRKCSINKNLKTLELKGTNVFIKLSKRLGRKFGLQDKNKPRMFNVPFSKMNYELIPMEEPAADLEWQSEAGEWLKDQDFDMTGIYT